MASYNPIRRVTTDSDRAFLSRFEEAEHRLPGKRLWSDSAAFAAIDDTSIQLFDKTSLELLGSFDVSALNIPTPTWAFVDVANLTLVCGTMAMSAPPTVCALDLKTGAFQIFQDGEVFFEPMEGTTRCRLFMTKAGPASLRSADGRIAEMLRLQSLPAALADLSGHDFSKMRAEEIQKLRRMQLRGVDIELATFTITEAFERQAYLSASKISMACVTEHRFAAIFAALRDLPNFAPETEHVVPLPRWSHRAVADTSTPLRLVYSEKATQLFDNDRLCLSAAEILPVVDTSKMLRYLLGRTAKHGWVVFDAKTYEAVTKLSSIPELHKFRIRAATCFSKSAQETHLLVTSNNDAYNQGSGYLINLEEAALSIPTRLRQPALLPAGAATLVASDGPAEGQCLTQFWIPGTAAPAFQTPDKAECLATTDDFSWYLFGRSQEQAKHSTGMVSTLSMFSVAVVNRHTNAVTCFQPDELALRPIAVVEHATPITAALKPFFGSNFFLFQQIDLFGTTVAEKEFFVGIIGAVPTCFETTSLRTFIASAAEETVRALLTTLLTQFTPSEVSEICSSASFQALVSTRLIEHAHPSTFPQTLRSLLRMSTKQTLRL